LKAKVHRLLMSFSVKWRMLMEHGWRGQLHRWLLLVNDSSLRKWWSLIDL
jgi:hypothetical protein